MLTGRHFQWRYHFTTVVYWVLGGFGGWPWDGGHGAGFLVPAISFFIGRELESVPRSRAVSLSQEATPADGRMSSPLPPWLAFTPGEAASIGIGFIPVFGTAASVYEVATGRDLFTGEEVHRGMAMIGVVPGGRFIKAIRSRGNDELILVKQHPSTTQGIPVKPTASNPDLQRAIDALFQPKDKIPGGTAGAVRHEIATGKPVEGRYHAKKAENTLGRLRNIMRDNKLSENDPETAQKFIDDLSDALKKSGG